MTGKGNKERMLFLNDACRAALKEYLKVRPVDGVPQKEKNALFSAASINRISPENRAAYCVFQSGKMRARQPGVFRT